MASVYSLYANSTFIFIIFIGIFATIYGVMGDKFNRITPFNSILTVSTILIIAFGLISLFYIKAVPSVFTRYVIMVSNISLLVMALSLFILSN